MKNHITALIVLITVSILVVSIKLPKKIHKWRNRSSFHAPTPTQENKIMGNLLDKFPITEKKAFVVVITSYNNETVCERNLFSVFDQTYDNYRIIYIDDCSTDKTYEKVQEFIKERNQEERVTLIHNETRKLKLSNLYHAYTSCKDDEIIVCLDGDDWIAHGNVLKELNHYYQNPDVWLTYGSAINHPKYEKRDGAIISDDDLHNNKVRDIHFNISMIRTFYAGLFKKIKLKDLLYKGKFLPSADDFAFMVPMIEMSPTHSLFIPDVFYIINDSNPIRENLVLSSLQVNLMNYLKAKEKYKPLDNTFDPRNVKSLAMQTPPQLIVISNNTPEALSKNLKATISNTPPSSAIHVLYNASTPAQQEAYIELSNIFPTVTFSLRDEVSFKNLVENSSDYIAIVTDTFSLAEPINTLDCIKEMELTSSVNFFVGQSPPLQGSIKLKESITAISFASALKTPELFTNSFFIIFQKKFLLDNLIYEEPLEGLLKSLYLKEENHFETALFFTS